MVAARTPFWKHAKRDAYAACQPATLRSTVHAKHPHGWHSVRRDPTPQPSAIAWRPRLDVPPVAIMKPTKKRKMKKDEPEATATETQNGRYAVRARTFRLRLDKEQRRTLSNWMGGARYTFNAALAAIKRKDIKFSDGISALQRRFVGGKQNARTSGAPDPRVGELVAQKPWLKQTPSAIRRDALKDLIDAQKSNLAKLENAQNARQRHRWRLKFRKRTNPSAWTITIQEQNIGTVASIPRPCTRHKDDAKNDHVGRRTWTSVTVFPRAMAKPLLLTRMVPGNAIAGAIKITRNRRGQYHAIVPLKTPWDEIPTAKPMAERKVVALDSGSRAFQTCYSPSDGCSEYCAKSMGYNRVFDEALKCDRVVSQLARDDLTNLERKRLNGRRHRLHDRCRNMTTDLHRRVAHDLLARYDTILIPSFETGRMTRKRNLPEGMVRKLNSKAARALLGLRHFAFRQALVARSQMLGKEVCVVGEEYTTKTCGACGALHNKIGSSETFRCPSCTYMCGRDENAARNIFLKHIRE